MQLKLLVDGGSMKPGPAVAQKLGPMGINMGKVISDVNLATKEFSGMQVPVVLEIDKKTKNYEIKVLSPPISQMIKKELNLETGSGARRKFIAGNISFEQIISVAKKKQPNMLTKNLLSAVHSTIGSCLSLGILIDNKDPKEIIQDLKQGKYDKEIKTQKTQASPEKMQELADFFAKINEAQKAELKKQQDKEKEEAAAAKATTPAAATPVAAAKEPAKKK
jgi:large subunit ribosomal protein L11